MRVLRWMWDSGEVVTYAKLRARGWPPARVRAKLHWIRISHVFPYGRRHLLRRRRLLRIQWYRRLERRNQYSNGRSRS